MNINPSDMDVRQGYAPAEVVTTAPSAAPVQQKSAAPEAAQASELDLRSQAAAATADRKVALETAEKISKQLEESATTLKIRLRDNARDGVQVEIVDKSSEKILRKIPQDELIRLSASMKQMSGVFLNQST